MDLTDDQWKEIAKVVKFMADTGEGTDYCLEQGCLPLPVHYYSPIPDIRDLDARDVWNRKSSLRGIDMRPEAEASLLRLMASRYAMECSWPENESENKSQFHWRNNSFSFQCASLLHYMIRHYKPKRIIEVGSGNSSKVISEAVCLNTKETGEAIDYQIVDPFPSEVTKALPYVTKLNAHRVEELTPEFFGALRSNDILFIDSGHVVKIGADVNFLILDVLPSLAPGVVVHFHDIPMPSEYGRVYYTTPSFRMLWTESYLLQAFLSCNSEYEVLVGMVYLNQFFPEVVAAAFPNDAGGSSSGSFWIRRKT